MADRTSYDHGTPCWIDLSSPDVDASKAFYGELFGWEATDTSDAEGNYIYTNFSLDGKVAAGLGAQQEQMAGMPPIWNSYVNVDDAAQIVKAAEAAGGTVMMPPMQVMEHGTMAVFADPTGAVICVWQAGEHIGAQVVNEPNAYSWNELMTRDVDASLAFYSQVFGWTYDGVDMGPMGTYHVVQGGSEGRAGIMAMPDDMPDRVPNYWGVYFIAEDTDALCVKATELGGTVVMGPMDSPVGRLATIHDPHMGTFSLMQPPTGDEG